jgi:hypothetical protein
VASLERILRQIVVVLGAYSLGVGYPNAYPYVVRAVEYLGIAWITCIVLLVMAYYMRLEQIRRQTEREEKSMLSRDEELAPLLGERESQHQRERGDLTMVLRQEDALRGDVDLQTDNEDDDAGEPYDEDIEAQPQEALLEPQQPQQQAHPALSQLYIINNASGQRCFPNSFEPAFELDNDLFCGRMMVLIRTPDVDDSSVKQGTAQNSQQFVPYFADKQRRWEFQWQIRLKKKPEGQVYFCCELEDSVKMGVLQRAFVGAAMAFCQKMSSAFHYSITGSTSSDGEVERPHMAFGVERSMTRIIVTKPGQGAPPELGSTLPDEDPDHLNSRTKTGFVDWNTEDTYTMAVWTAYFDFLQWKSLNFPGKSIHSVAVAFQFVHDVLLTIIITILSSGIKPFSLASVVGPQHIRLSLYSLLPTKSGSDAKEKHYESNLERCADLEISNSTVIAPGPAAKKWIADRRSGRSNAQRIITNTEVVGETTVAIHDSLSRDFGENDSVDDIDEDMFLEEQTIAELCEGLYLRSGEEVLLNVISEDKEIDGFITNGGGFAVVQHNTSATMVVEKANKSSKRKARKSLLIRSGDVVMIKLLLKDNDETEVRYLSIHRGWWLKWVAQEPKKNGFFSVHTHETELVEGGVSPRAQSPYITLGGAFRLRHKRWNGYHVGVRTQESATFGGRMLGLYDSAYKSDGDDDLDQEADDDAESGGKWMKPILFTASMAPSISKPSTPRLLEIDMSLSFDAQDSDEATDELHLTTANSSLDVPVWIEMMHRSSRRRQLVYVVRVIVEQDYGVPKQEGDAQDNKTGTAFSRLRSGKTLAQIIQTGLGRSIGEIGPDQDLLKPIKLRSDDVPLKATGSLPLDVPSLEQAESTETNEQIAWVSATPTSPRCSFPSTPHQSDLEDDEDFEDSGDELSDVGMLDLDMLPAHADTFTPTKKQRKGRNIIDQIAQSVKTSTAKTGKQVVRQSKKVGKGTVSAGKAIIAPMSRGSMHSKKPPMREPKVAKAAKPSTRANNRKTKKDLLSVNRTMKKIGKRHAKTWLSEPNVLAGQLSPPEQSLRTTSHALSRMSNAAPHTQLAKKFEEIANKEFAPPSELDSSFLKGGAFQLGVVPPEDQILIYDSLVARCLWESHWREEWCGVYEKSIMFFGPTSKQSSLQLSYVDIISVRQLGSRVFSPLPGYPMLAIDTSWQCYYVAFPDEVTRHIFSEKIETQVKYHAEKESPEDPYQNLWKARFWQGFQDSVDAAVSTGNRKWAKILSGTNAQHRSVMNGRRMVFDVEPWSPVEESDVPDIERIESFVAKLLNLALVTTFDSLETNPASFVAFLDMTSQLRAVPLTRINLTQPAALCIFTNLYHSLLQHALLLTIHGPLHKKSVGHFFRTTCYEIGGDVFSLAELYHCVVRGNMSKPVSPKNPYLDVPRKSTSYHFYALNYIDPRINFILNTGDVSCPQQVPVLRSTSLESQLQIASREFVKRLLSVDNQKRLIILPKVCEIYRHDFGGDGESSSFHSTCLSFCVNLLSTEERVKITKFMVGDTPYAIKFAPCAEQYHQLLSALLLNPQEEETPSSVVTEVVSG